MENERLPEATVIGAYAYGWQQFKKYFLYLFLIGVVLGVANSPSDWLRPDRGPDMQSAPMLLQLLVVAYTVLILPVINYGGDFLNVRFMRNDKADVGDMFAGFRNGYLNIILANLLVVAIVMIGFILLIVPGIILAIRLAFVPYIVMDKGLDPVAAVEKSWAMTRGHSWTIFGMALLAIPIFAAGILLLLVGAFFAYLWIKTAFASLYHALDLDEQRRLDANGNGGPADGRPSGGGVRDEFRDPRDEDRSLREELRGLRDGHRDGGAPEPA